MRGARVDAFLRRLGKWVWSKRGVRRVVRFFDRSTELPVGGFRGGPPSSGHAPFLTEEEYDLGNEPDAP